MQLNSQKSTSWRNGPIIVLLLTGYTDNYVYINNPYGQKNQKLNRSQFEAAWKQMGSQALVIKHKQQ